MTNWTKSPDYEPIEDRVPRSVRPVSGMALSARRDQPGQVPRTPRSGQVLPDVRSDASADRAERRAVVAEEAKTIEEAPASAVDAARYLVASLQHQNDDRVMPSRLGFTSALAGEGVTFISRTVAAVIAHDFRERVCVIDLNWGETTPRSEHDGSTRRRGSRAANGDHPEPEPGLADALRRQVALRDVILPTDDPRLTVVTAGAATAAEGQVFARSDELSHIIKVLERHNDRLIFDLPAVLVSSAAIALARQAEAVALVVRHGVTTEAQVRSALDRLGQIPSAGVVLNRTSSKIPRPLLRRLSNW